MFSPPQLDKLVEKQRETHRRMLEQLLMVEQSHKQALYKLEDEKRNHGEFMKKSDEFTNLLEQERERSVSEFTQVALALQCIYVGVLGKIWGLHFINSEIWLKCWFWMSFNYIKARVHELQEIGCQWRLGFWFLFFNRLMGVFFLNWR